MPRIPLWGLIIAFNLAAPIGHAEEDFLSDDDFIFEDEADSVESAWLESLTVSAEHAQTQTHDQITLQRSSLRLEFDSSFAKNWYLKVDHKTQFYWSEDSLTSVTEDDEATRYRLQQAWLQYSKGACYHKLGKQQLIWGNVDGTFALDVITPFDYSEQLLTDYNSLRLAQNMWLSECFQGAWQYQGFFIHDAKTDQVALVAPKINRPSMNEYGTSIKYSWAGGDITFVSARLLDNTPSIALNQSGIDNSDLENIQAIQQAPSLFVDQFSLWGISVSQALGRLLVLFDIGYKTNQAQLITEETAGSQISVEAGRSDRIDAAIGIEYTTPSNHNFNLGVWGNQSVNALRKADSNSALVTAGWRKSYLNDNLVMSLLSNYSNEPKIISTTLLAQYQWSDELSLSVALGYIDAENQTFGINLGTEETTLTLSAKYSF